jgi:hypothetical protein
VRKIAICRAIAAGALLALMGSCHLLFYPTGDEPGVIIDRPAPAPGGGVQLLGRVIHFGWRAGGDVNPRCVRYMFSQVVDTNGVYNPTFNIVEDLNRNPGRYENKWGPWISFYAQGDSGRSTVLGDDEILEINRSHIFAVQAMDRFGTITTRFGRTSNVRQFIVSASVAPLLRVTEPVLGSSLYMGMTASPTVHGFPQGLPLAFRWVADASSYGSVIEWYRYGWDVVDINDPDAWAVPWSPGNTFAPPQTWYSGVHTLFVEAIDDVGMTTLGMIEINIVPFTMDRNLLWVDDFASNNFTQVDYSMPTENEHDTFWLSICGGAQGFNPGTDVYDAYYSHSMAQPPLEYIGRYRNIIWSFGSSKDNGVLDDVILFTPESMVGAGTTPVTNSLAMFLRKGGHLLTEGRAERGGGLAACLQAAAQVFPLNLRCEITGPRTDCSGDTSGVNTIAYRDFCVTMIDKVVGTFRSDADMPMRRVRNYDCMSYAVKADDPVTQALVGLPDQLDLWSTVTQPGRYFDPMAPEPYPGGFTYVEAYDPAYWMNRNMVGSQPCFHPMFLMRTKNSSSALNNAAAALVLTKYENVVPSTGGVAAKSFHFGFPLWFFNRTQVDQIMHVVFAEWQIATGP